jgi:MYXO-CTERM domain-containing protein
MNVRTALGAVAVVALTTAAQADVTIPDGETIDIGTFLNTGLGTIDYQGGYADYINAEADGAHTRIDIDLGGVLTVAGHQGFVAVRVFDTGSNIYGSLSSGADIDMFGFSDMSDGVDWTFRYDGPNGIHQGETADMLALRVAAMDAVNGDSDAANTSFVSLGSAGVLTAVLSAPQGIMNGPAFTDPIGPLLHLSEAGVGESFLVQVVAAPVPGPPAIGLMALAGLRGRRRRRD